MLLKVCFLIELRFKLLRRRERGPLLLRDLRTLELFLMSLRPVAVVVVDGAAVVVVAKTSVPLRACLLYFLCILKCGGVASTICCL